jgi:hypothetical protein
LRVQEVVQEHGVEQGRERAEQREVHCDARPDERDARADEQAEAERAHDPARSGDEQRIGHREEDEVDRGDLLERHRGSHERADAQAGPPPAPPLPGEAEEEEVRQHERKQHEPLGIRDRTLHPRIRREEHEEQGRAGCP